MEYEFHEVADIFPLMQGEEFAQLVSDVREHGLREAIWLYDDKIIDGRNRYRACLEADVEPEFREWDGNGSLVAFVVSLNLHRRHLNESQRAMVGAKIANMGEGRPDKTSSIELVSQSEASDLLNVGVASIKRAKKVLDEGSLVLVSKVESGEVAVSTAAEIAELEEEEQEKWLARGESEILRKAKEIKRDRATRRMEERSSQRAEIVAKHHPLSGDLYRLLQGDLLDAGTSIADESVDAIITDPPYPEEFLYVYPRLWKLAGRVLRPGGHLLVMVGQSHLPKILTPFSAPHSVEGISYQWTLGYFTPGQSTQVFGRKVKSNWKPVLWFVKGANTWEHIEDTVRSDMNDKRFHHWGQSVGGLAQLISRFTVKKHVILDPFVGGGSTGVAAVSLERIFIGVDIDSVCLQQTAERLQQLQEAA